MDSNQYLVCADIGSYMFHNILDVETIISLARVCKSFLHIVLSKDILTKIVSECLEKTESEVSKYRPHLGVQRNMEELKDDPSIFNSLIKNAALPKFFYTSIPIHLTCERLKFPSIKISYDDCFVTGGKVCQSVYEKEWKSDVDVWMEGQDHWEIYDSTVNDDFDIVFKNFEPYRCISGFDLSICMQGIEIKDEKRVEHVTPLGLFTYYTKKIVATLGSDTIDYNVTRYNPFLYYLIHHRFSFLNYRYYTMPNRWCGHTGNFSSCDHCRSSIHDDKMITWLDRLQKYQNRFPDYEICFVPA